jgi:hypothetical protein
MRLLKKSLLAAAIMFICGSSSLYAKPLAVVQESNLCGERAKILPMPPYMRNVPYF